MFVDPKIDAPGNESKREHTEKCDCNCDGLFEMRRKGHIVGHLEDIRLTLAARYSTHIYRLCMSFREVFEVQSDSRTSNRVEISGMG